MTTLRELIDALEYQAQAHGDNFEVCVSGNYGAAGNIYLDEINFNAEDNCIYIVADVGSQRKRDKMQPLEKNTLIREFNSDELENLSVGSIVQIEYLNRCILKEGWGNEKEINIYLVEYKVEVK